jgi:hypothetical protein
MGSERPEWLTCKKYCSVFHRKVFFVSARFVIFVPSVQFLVRMIIGKAHAIEFFLLGTVCTVRKLRNKVRDHLDKVTTRYEQTAAAYA